MSSNNPWQEIRQYCNFEANNNNNKYEISTINQTHTNDNNIEYLNAEVSTINQTHEIYEISSDTEDTVEQKHARLDHILNEVKCLYLFKTICNIMINVANVIYFRLNVFSLNQKFFIIVRNFLIILKKN